MKDRVLKVISQTMKVRLDNITDESSPDTIDGWDSLKHMQLILTLEEEFGVRFTDTEIMEMLSVRRIFECLAQRISYSK